jgi:hypothetical protein
MNIDDIYATTPRIRHARFVCPGRDLPPPRRAPKSHQAKLNAALKLMKSLRSSAQFAIETLQRSTLEQPLGKEAIMLDVAFVALGLAALALMAVYALALRQL